MRRRDFLRRQVTLGAALATIGFASRVLAQPVTRYFVSAASYLRQDGQTVLDSLSKMEAAFQPGAKIEMLLQGQKLVEARIFSPRKPAALTVNGKAAAYEHHPKERTIRFRHET